jgi:hypothetical protein
MASLAVTVNAQEKAADPIDETRKAMQANRNALEKLKVPMATEPAFVFKV